LKGRAGAALDRLVDALAVVAGALLCALVLLVCLDVAARSLKLFATPWTLDITQYMLYAITFLGAPWVLREDGHIAIEVFIEPLGPRARRGLRRASDSLGAAVCAVLLFYACRLLWRSIESQNLVYATFVFPEWYLFCLAPPVFLLLLLLFLGRLRGATPERPRESPREGL
jgi:TRAP-type transport system small permease protein